MRLRKSIWGNLAVPIEMFRGVVKLGFSWQGDDVLPFQGLRSLVDCLGNLFNQRQSEQLVCIVQEMVPGVVGEHRVLCFHNELDGSFHREGLWVQMKSRGTHHIHKCDVKEFTLASAKVVHSSDVALELFNGDTVAHAFAEAAAQELVDRWLLFFRTEAAEPPQVTRIDFLVCHTGPGLASVWTCEVGECGASLCSVEVDARNAAALNNAIQFDDSGRFPAPLPTQLIRNNGWKS